MPPYAFHVAIFKKINHIKVPNSINSESLANFFTVQLIFASQAVKLEFERTTKLLISNPSFLILAITAMVYQPDKNVMIHSIIGAALYMHEKSGSLIFCIGVHNRGDPQVCSLSDKCFVEHEGARIEYDQPLLSPTAHF
jgi:hypothetical protein